jgi:hypothetical protein
MPVCRQCNLSHDDPRYFADGLCYGCQCDSWIPPGYQDRELYRYDTTWGHENATCRPALGVSFLDRHAPATVEQWIYNVAKTDKQLLAFKLLAAGYTQDQAADRVGVAASTIRSWLTHERNMERRCS